MIPRKSLTLAALIFLITGVCAAGSSWVVRQDGVGPAKIGMSLPQLSTALGEKFALPQDKEDQGCFYVTSAEHPQVSFMIENGHLVRVDIDKSGVATNEGVQVGDSEEHVKQVYGSRLKVERHKYTDGHYLTVQNGNYGVRFETDEGKVSGLIPTQTQCMCTRRALGMGRTMIISLAIALLSACALVFAQDPVKVAPKQYSVLLENDRVRVLKGCLKPGERIPMHSHPARVIYELADHASRFTFPDAPAVVSRSSAGEVKWGNPVTHSEENIGTTEGCALIIELKR
jgi:hypothetical protein